MKTKIYATIILLCLLVISVFSINYLTSHKEQEHPNIILITIDSLNKEYLEPYGYEERISPNIDELSKSSYVFHNHVTQSTYTFPSVTSLITSSYPRELGELMPYNSTLKERKKTIAEYLKEAGYKTYGINAGARLQRGVGLEQGFDYYKRLYPPDAELQITHIINKLNKTEKNENFFLWAHNYDVHCPYSPPKEYNEINNETMDPNVTYRVNSCKQIYKNGEKLEKEKFNYILENYKGEIRYTDEELGRLFDYLKRKGVFKNTLIIVTADHGEEMYSHKHKFIGHGIDFYDSIVNIPLLVKLPNQKNRKEIKYQTRNIDLLPTILEVANIDYNKNEIRGKNIFNHSDSRIGFTEIEGRGNNKISIRYENYKYTNLRERLFNLEEDPEELNNIIDKKKEIKENFLNILKEWREMTKEGDFTGETYVSDEIKKRLEELGYTQ